MFWKGPARGPYYLGNFMKAIELEKLSFKCRKQFAFPMVLRYRAKRLA